MDHLQECPHCHKQIFICPKCGRVVTLDQAAIGVDHNIENESTGGVACIFCRPPKPNLLEYQVKAVNAVANSINGGLSKYQQDNTTGAKGYQDLLEWQVQGDIY